MLTGKAVTISTSFLFKMLVDVVGGKDFGRDLNVASSALLLADSLVRLPVLLLLAYGLCQSSSSLLCGYTNVVFSHVAQLGIRNFGRLMFDHVHALNIISPRLQHRRCNTGALSPSWSAAVG
jgi:hypothetical protein